MIKTLSLAQKNGVDCLALTPSAGNFLVKNIQTFYCQLRLDNKIKEPEELSCWQDPPEDVKEMIVKHMSFSGRVRLSSLCKSWRIASMRKEIPTCPQLPWLLHPQPKTGNSLSFSSLSEGKVFKSRLPCPDLNDFKSRLNRLSGRTNETSIFLNSSRGWLVMKEWEPHYRLMINRVLVIDLVNPASGAQQRLPPLQTIPGCKQNSVDSLLDQVVLSNPDVSKTMVAATLGRRKLLLCRPRDKSWRVFQVFDENDRKGCIDHILFSSTGIVYALVKHSSNCGGEVWIENRSLKFGDDEVELKVIYDKEEWWIDEGLFIQEGSFYKPYLSESTNNELLLIYQITGADVGEDVIEGNVDAEEGNNNNGEEDENNNMDGNVRNYESVLGWVGQVLRKALILMHLKSFINDDKPEISDRRTRCFRVYKIDQDNNRFRRVQDLGDQILFLANDTSSLSLSASDFKELRGNCIYFAARGMASGIIHTSREIGIFYLDTERIERSFPSFEMREYSQFSWLMPSLW